MGKRRGNHEGSIYQTSDGRWRAAVSLGDGRRKYLTARTRAEVVQKMRALQRKVEAGLNLLTPAQHLTEYLDDWLEHTIRRQRAPKTYSTYSYICETFIKPAAGHITVDRLTAAHVQMLLNKMADEGLSQSTITLVRSVLTAALQYAVKSGHLVRNIATLTDVPRSALPPIPGRALSDSEIQQLLSANADHRLINLVRFLLMTGARRHEAMGLQWSHIDQDAQLLTLPSTKSGPRTIAASDSLLALLRAQQARQMRERLVAGKRWQDSGYVFTGRSGQRLSLGNLEVVWTRMRTIAGVECRMHDLRHTAVSLMVQGGTPIKTIMAIVGHKRIDTTLNVYAHSDDTSERTALEALALRIGA